MKKLLFTGVLVSQIAFNSVTFSFPKLGLGQFTDNLDVSSIVSSTKNFNVQLLSMSSSLLVMSKSMLATPTAVNTEYVKAMLKLSGDIGTMADRIGQMGDKIVKTQAIQNVNIALVSNNSKQARNNFSQVLRRQ